MDVDQEARIKEKLRLYRRNPIEMVRREFGVEPDPWQAEMLDAFADPTNERIGLKACKGPGKTAGLAWCAWNFLATRKYCRIGATSITGDNLRDNLWSEMAKWQSRSKFLSEAFVWQAQRIVNRLEPANWWMSARTWPKTGDSSKQADTMAGLHADYVMGIIDESGGVPQAVMTTLEALLATGKECRILQAGNPTHLSGPLYRMCAADRHLWKIITITGDPDNPRRSPRIKMEWARQQIASYGRDNPWVMVNVLGEFPPSSINALFEIEQVELAMGKHLRPDQYDYQQKRLGVDVARFGDDRTVIFPRQGLASFRPVVIRRQRTTDIAARVMRAIQRWGAETVLVDDTGHWGHGVIDNLQTGGWPATPVIFNDRAINPRYKNRRAEMWLGMSDWIKRGGALPNLPELVEELVAPTYTFVNGVFLLEDKEQIKERIGRSPDLADGLALTFAIPEMPNEVVRRLKNGRRNQVARDADPFDPSDRGTGRVEHDADPFDPIRG